MLTVTLWILVGNLPFSATTESINQHFAKVRPRSVRHRTQKDTDKSKGFAFLEFDAYDRMKTCLKSYHHSNFDDGKSPSRKINVELTWVPSSKRLNQETAAPLLTIEAGQEAAEPRAEAGKWNYKPKMRNWTRRESEGRLKKKWAMANSGRKPKTYQR